MTAEELLELFNSMENKEKNKFLDSIQDKYFPMEPPTREKLLKWAREIIEEYEGDI